MLSDVRAAIGDRWRAARADRAFPRSPPPSGESAPEAPRHVVCIVADALRHDAIDPSRTPFLASLDPLEAVAASTWTFPSVTSLLAGQHPHRHGAMRADDAFASSVADVTGLPAPTEAGPLLPERLAGAGYDTFAAFGMIVPFLALGGRFADHRLYRDAGAGDLLAAHEAWIRERAGERTFSYVHLADAHEPVDPPEAYWEAHGVDESIPGIRGWDFEDVLADSPTVDRYREHRRRLYAAVVEHLDHRVGAHVRRLEDLLPEDPLVVVTADHGEGLWEHARFAAEAFADPRPAYCVGHGGAPFEPISRVPLAFSGPASVTATPSEGQRPPAHVDVAPTILEAVGLNVPEADGHALQAADALDGAAIVEGARYGYEKKAVHRGGRRLVVSAGDDVAYAIDADEAPTVDDLRSDPAEADAELAARLPPWPDGSGALERPSSAVQRRLAELGYM